MTATRRSATARESRELLIRAATELFAEQGFRRTTFADVAGRAGISRGSIPWHFGNKDGLLQAVIDEAVRSIATREGPEPVGIQAALSDALEIVRLPSTRLFITLLAEAVEPGSPIRGHYAQLHAALRDRLGSRIGEIDLPAGMTRDDFLTVVFGAVIGINQQWSVAPERVDLDRAFAALSLSAGRTAVPD
ncbi:TetR family transcriptional regulator [Nocardia terpenica]|uniref:TetR family transcriptional regulator n=1 Tax=Nocardia terpenica TaxID=455432 RepID=A0A6G9Z1V8_9NOCA|nr:TetR family transcriptional regulator [Nocardia terpenica]QIS19462.1 TetR family transcriptional regulator [Nocardia terpenica]